jgi:hypothetical protein
VGRGRTNDGNDELADDHGQATDEENPTTTEALNEVERDGSSEHVHERGDKGDQEGVGDCAECLEEGGAEVEDEVDTGELLGAL